MTNSFPPRRSSDLEARGGGLGADRAELRRRRPGDQPRHRQCGRRGRRSEEHTSELQSLMRISYAVFCLKKTTTTVRARYRLIADAPTSTSPATHYRIPVINALKTTPHTQIT